MELKINITEREVLSTYGYQSIEEVEPRIQNIVTEMIDKGEKLADFKSVTYDLGEIRINKEEELIFINDDYKIESAYLTTKLYGSSKATVGLATIGFQIEEKIGDYFNEENYLKATILDVVGNILLDRVTKQVWHAIRNCSLEQGLGVSGYYSPGDGDWTIRDQEFLFKLLSGDQIGVYLTSKQVLSPQKSLLFIIGQGSSLDVDEYEPCLDCPNQDCLFQIKY
ncbi:hypothetical protein [Sporohalobacter salinus]|uniref:hypothetical protein n=1 Tax=Sporohalobacter salinus TaxID=1494606 RepID=UPI00195F6A9D|nr:hypothetical protein [Sporohalobacter salinus]MBM7623417.1 hypothetical protein [Sporohalobacter salinus]